MWPKMKNRSVKFADPHDVVNMISHTNLDKINQKVGNNDMVSETSP